MSEPMTGMKVKMEQAHAKFIKDDSPMPEPRKDWLAIILALIVTAIQLLICSLVLQIAWNFVIPERPMSYEQAATAICMIYFIRKYVK